MREHLKNFTLEVRLLQALCELRIGMLSSVKCTSRPVNTLKSFAIAQDDCVTSLIALRIQYQLRHLDAPSPYLDISAGNIDVGID